MADLFNHQYRIPTARLKGADYSQGMYFVTLCTKDMACVFGAVAGGEMKLSAMGKIAYQCWQDIPLHFRNAMIDMFVVMPNHVHGIVILNRDCPDCARRNEILQCRDEALPRLYMADPRPDPNIHAGGDAPAMPISSKSGSLPVVIGSYKSIVSRRIHRDLNHQDFSWQARFHDHIIRNGNEHARIRAYISNNPVAWPNTQSRP